MNNSVRLQQEEQDQKFVTQRLAELRSTNAFPRPEKPPRTMEELRLEHIPDVSSFIRATTIKLTGATELP